jgi:hypothetical protein
MQREWRTRISLSGFVPREVSHWIYFTSEADRGKFCEAMRELRYEILSFLL